MRKLTIAICLVLALSSYSLAQQKRQRSGREYPPKMADAKAEVYKTVGDVELNIYTYAPADHKPSDQRPAIVFFFGGGWRSGSPAQFREQCKYLASRGMVAMTADYRVRNRHSTTADCCVADAKSAVRWIRTNAKRLGIDPQKIAAGGGSAGGHIAACTGVVKGFEESGEDKSVSSVPNALALFNPALALAPVEGKGPLAEERMATLPERMGVKPVELSPYHHVAKGVPPTIIFHGKGDETVPYWTAEVFAMAMKKAGNRCKLIGYDEQPHGFFNFGRDKNKMFNATVAALDEFLTELRYLTPKPNGRK